jgi:hypothetical protein
MAGAGAEAHATGSATVDGVGSAGGSGGGSVGEVGVSGEAHAGFADHHLNFGLGGDVAAGLGIDIDFHVSIDTRPFEHAWGALSHTVGPAIAHEAQAIGHDIGHAAHEVGHAIGHEASHVGHAIGHEAKHIGHAVKHFFHHW